MSTLHLCAHGFQEVSNINITKLSSMHRHSDQVLAQFPTNSVARLTGQMLDQFVES